MESVREQLIELAIEAVEDGLNQNEATVRYSVPPSTLNRRLHGSHAPRKAKEKKTTPFYLARKLYCRLGFKP